MVKLVLGYILLVVLAARVYSSSPVARAMKMNTTAILRKVAKQSVPCEDAVNTVCLPAIVEQFRSSDGCGEENPPDITSACCPGWLKIFDCVTAAASDSDQCSPQDRDQTLAGVAPILEGCSTTDLAPGPSLVDPFADVFVLCQNEIREACRQFFDKTATQDCSYRPGFRLKCCPSLIELSVCALAALDTSDECRMTAQKVYNGMHLDIEQSCIAPRPPGKPVRTTEPKPPPAVSSQYGTLSGRCVAQIERNCPGVLSKFDSSTTDLCSLDFSSTPDPGCCQRLSLNSNCVLRVTETNVDCDLSDFSSVSTVATNFGVNCAESSDDRFIISDGCRDVLSQECGETLGKVGARDCTYNPGFPPRPHCCPALKDLSDCWAFAADSGGRCSVKDNQISSDMTATVARFCTSLSKLTPSEAPGVSAECQRDVISGCTPYLDTSYTQDCPDEPGLAPPERCCSARRGISSCEIGTAKTSLQCSIDDYKMYYKTGLRLDMSCSPSSSPSSSPSPSRTPAISEKCKQDVEEGCAKYFEIVSSQDCGYESGRTPAPRCCSILWDMSSCASDLAGRSRDCSGQDNTFYSTMISNIHITCSSSPPSPSDDPPVSETCERAVTDRCGDSFEKMESEGCFYEADLFGPLPRCCPALLELAVCAASVSNNIVECRADDARSYSKMKKDIDLSCLPSPTLFPSDVPTISGKCEQDIAARCVDDVRKASILNCSYDPRHTTQPRCCPVLQDMASCASRESWKSPDCNKVDYNLYLTMNSSMYGTCSSSSSSSPSESLKISDPCEQDVSYLCAQYADEASAIRCSYEQGQATEARCCSTLQAMASCASIVTGESLECTEEDYTQYSTMKFSLSRTCSLPYSPSPSESPPISERCEQDIIGGCPDEFDSVSAKGCLYELGLPIQTRCCSSLQDMASCASEVAGSSFHCSEEERVLQSTMSLDLSRTCFFTVSPSPSEPPAVSEICYRDVTDRCEEYFDSASAQDCSHDPGIPPQQSCCLVLQDLSSCAFDVAGRSQFCNAEEYQIYSERKTEVSTTCSNLLLPSTTPELSWICEQDVIGDCAKYYDSASAQSCSKESELVQPRCCLILQDLASCSSAVAWRSGNCNGEDYSQYSTMESKLNRTCTHSLPSDAPAVSQKCERGITDLCDELSRQVFAQGCRLELAYGPCCTTLEKLAACQKEGALNIADCSANDARIYFEKNSELYSVCQSSLVPTESGFPGAGEECNDFVADFCRDALDSVTAGGCSYTEGIIPSLQCCAALQDFAACAIDGALRSNTCDTNDTTMYTRMNLELLSSCRSTVESSPDEDLETDGGCDQTITLRCKESADKVSTQGCYYEKGYSPTAQCCQPLQEFAACAIDRSLSSTDCSLTDVSAYSGMNSDLFSTCRSTAVPTWTEAPGVSKECEQAVGISCHESFSKSSSQNCPYNRNIAPSPRCCPSLQEAAFCAIHEAQISARCNTRDVDEYSRMNSILTSTCGPVPEVIPTKAPEVSDVCEEAVLARCRESFDIVATQGCSYEPISAIQPQCCEVLIEYSSCASDAALAMDDCRWTEYTIYRGGSSNIDQRCSALGSVSDTYLPSVIPAVDADTASPTGLSDEIPSSPSTTGGNGEFGQDSLSPSVVPSQVPGALAGEEACFPGRATVLLESGLRKRMDALEIGDVVLSSNGEFSKVFFFSHRTQGGIYNFFRISTEASSLIVSGGHYIRTEEGLVAARDIQVGSVVIGESGGTVAVRDVEIVHAEGLFNPHTMSGEIAVDGVQASCYTTTVFGPLAAFLLAPFRYVYRAGFKPPAFLNGHSPAYLLPSGPSTI